MRESVEFQHMYGYARFEPFPGNEDIAVSIRSKLRDGIRGGGLGTIYHEERLREAKMLGLDYLMCTVREDNVPQRKILLKEGWLYLDTFKSSRTNHSVCIYGRSIK